MQWISSSFTGDPYRSAELAALEVEGVICLYLSTFDIEQVRPNVIGFPPDILSAS
jgi:hypothetical protein